MSFSEDVLLVDRLPFHLERLNVDRTEALRGRCAASDLFLQRGERLLPSLG